MVWASEIIDNCHDLELARPLRSIWEDKAASDKKATVSAGIGAERERPRDSAGTVKKATFTIHRKGKLCHVMFLTNPSCLSLRADVERPRAPHDRKKLNFRLNRISKLKLKFIKMFGSHQSWVLFWTKCTTKCTRREPESPRTLRVWPVLPIASDVPPFEFHETTTSSSWRSALGDQPLKPAAQTSR
jgi:hypothetical protein